MRVTPSDRRRRQPNAVPQPAVHNVPGPQMWYTNRLRQILDAAVFAIVNNPSIGASDESKGPTIVPPWFTQ